MTCDEPNAIISKTAVQLKCITFVTTKIQRFTAKPVLLFSFRVTMTHLQRKLDPPLVHLSIYQCSEYRSPRKCSANQTVKNVFKELVFPGCKTLAILKQSYFLIKRAGYSFHYTTTHHWFSREMTSEKRTQKFLTDDVSLPRSEQCF